ncbi:unnamed protein product [Allacma fusca]|uniref:Uncharacterized protein n=1 Tax=Allacma fusca TaxID=39272 RepID=A0A8J2JFX0_9HEXA|nr:unnamed protein product [Allacma fusca]
MEDGGLWQLLYPNHRKDSTFLCTSQQIATVLLLLVCAAIVSHQEYQGKPLDIDLYFISTKLMLSLPLLLVALQEQTSQVCQ